MKIEESTYREDNKYLRIHTSNGIESNNLIDGTLTFSERETYKLKSKYSEHQFELFNLFLTAFRILYSKYQFTNEPLSSKITLSKLDATKSTGKQLFSTRIDFAALDPLKSTLSSVATATKMTFNKHLKLEEELSVFNFYEITFLALNTETEQIELDCAIKSDYCINISFKAPIGSQLAGVTSNSVSHFLNLLRAIEQSPAKMVSSTSMIDSTEQNQLIQWSQGAYNPTISRPSWLHSIFEQTCITYPENAAVFYNGQTFTYQQINEKANQLARYLHLKGIGRGDYCAILVPRSADMYIAMLAILKIGAAYIPMDVSIPKERLHFVLTDSGSKGIISHSRFFDKYEGHSCTKIILNDEESTISSFDAFDFRLIDQQPTPDDIAYIIYTSGTTGTPKGVKIPHSAICNLVRTEGEIFKLNTSDKVFQGFSISFDASLEEIWLAFYAGAQLFVGTEEIIQSGPQMATFINENQITVFSTVPTLLSTLSEDLPSVTTLILGGEACSMELVKKWSTVKRRMVNTYGPTEATVIATYSDCIPNKKVTIGKPVVNYCTYILDANQQIVPIGVAGELCIGGLSLAEGYINNPTLTALKFITPEFEINPNFPKRLYRSGDLVRYNQWGEIEFLGRIDSQIKLRGFRIELAEIESQLLNITSVKNCALTVKKDPNGLEHLIAYVVIHADQNFDPINTKKELRTKLAPYMIPSRFEVINEIPLLPSGKIDRKQLPDPTFEKEPVQKKRIHRTTEEYITHLWETLFGMGAIAPTDDFFDLGGHSLLASQMISTMRKDVRFEKLSVKDVYSYPTIEKLSLYIDHTLNSKENKSSFFPS